MRHDLIKFPDLAHAEFQHSLDQSATGMLKRLEGIRPAMSALETFSDTVANFNNLSNSVKVGPTQYPNLYRNYLQMAEILDVRRLPDLYVATSTQINAYAMGVDKYTIVLYTGLLDILNQQEVMAIIAHELGHVKCDHMLYNSLMRMIIQLGGPLLSQIPIPLASGIFDLSLKLALVEWSRRAEFSADRAALLATQDPEAITGALSKLAGFSKTLDEPISIEALKEQATDFEGFTSKNPIAMYLWVEAMLQITHPFVPLRVREISQWAESAHYQKILSGKYRRLTEQVIAEPQLPKGLLCGQCQTVNPTDYRFCYKCNRNLSNTALVCGRCKKPVFDDYKFCPSCTADLLPSLALPAVPTP
jgi:Zn-dependent protease with chaperone function